jgi:hypothetical protein
VAPNRSGFAINSATAPAGVEPAAVKVVRPAERARQRVGPLGHRNEMNMVGHQAVAQEAQAVAPAFTSQQGQIEAAIAVVEEGFLAVVSPLRNMVRRAHRNHASMAWHGRKSRIAWTEVSKLSLSPFCRTYRVRVTPTKGMTASKPVSVAIPRCPTVSAARSPCTIVSRHAPPASTALCANSARRKRFFPCILMSHYTAAPLFPGYRSRKRGQEEKGTTLHNARFPPR